MGRTHSVTAAIAAGLFTIVGGAVADDDAAGTSRFANELGWEWMIQPFSIKEDPRRPAMGADNGIVLLAEEGTNHQLIIMMSHPGAGRPIAGYDRFRPIAIDVDGRRLEVAGVVEMGVRVPDREHFVFMGWYRLKDETVAADRVALIGLEGLTRDGAKGLAAAAAEKARALGLVPLPYVEVGQHFAFELTDIDGNKVDSRDLLGKVVLLDMWAGWCFPCMQKMPELKELYAQWHEQGFEVVGINFDDEQQTCRDLVEKLELSWRQTMGPPDGELRELWFDAIGSQSLKLLLIDREGRLFAVCAPDDLEAKVTELMMRPQ